MRFVRTYRVMTGHQAVALLHIVYLHRYEQYVYHRRLANAVGPAQNTLVGRGLAFVEPVTHALSQHGTALESLRSADVVHKHTLLTAAADIPLKGPLLY